MKFIPYVAYLMILISCQSEIKKTSTNDDTYNFIAEIDLPKFNKIQKVYVPAYSNLYYLDGSSKLYYTVVLSLRNISFTDTIYFTNIDYYSHNGEKLRAYTNSPFILKPMESVEFIVEQEDKEGGAGANFVVSYGVKVDAKNKPIIESVMSGTAGQYGFAFKSEGVPIIE